MKKKKERLDNQLIVFLCGIFLLVLFEIIQVAANVVPMYSNTFLLSNFCR